MAEIFMRPAMVLDTQANEIAHCELYNPAASDRRCVDIEMWISKSTDFTILLRGGAILSGASFSESRGLPIEDGAVRPYSQAHARTKRTLETNPDGSIAYVEGGQLWNHVNPSGGIVHIKLPVVLGVGNGLLIRNWIKGEKLRVAFLWREVPLGG